MCSAVSSVDQTSGKPEAESNQVKKFYWKIHVTGKKYAELETKTRAQKQKRGPKNKNTEPRNKYVSKEKLRVSRIENTRHQ